MMATKHAAAGQAGEHLTEMLPFDVPVDISATAEEPTAEPEIAAADGAAVASADDKTAAGAIAAASDAAIVTDATSESVAAIEDAALSAAETPEAAGPDAAAAPEGVATVASGASAPKAPKAPKASKVDTAKASSDGADDAEAVRKTEETRKAEAAAALLAAKDAVRREALSRRQELRPATRSARSREICNQLLSYLQASGIKGRNGRPATISVYAALRFEVDLDRFIRGAYALGYRIAFPCMTPRDKDRANDRSAGTMCMRSVSCLNYVGGSVPFIVDPRKPWGPAVADEHQQFTNTPTGSRRRFIPSRVKGSIPPKDDTRFPVVPPSEIDMAIIPAAAFDAEGRRLGYGTGVYDRYLPQLREGCLVVGVAFAEQEVTEVPCDEHDCTLPHYITA